MTMSIRSAAFAVFVALLAVAPARAGVTATETFVQEFPLDIGGSFWLDDPLGNVEIIGTDGPGMIVTAVKITNGSDKGSIEEGRRLTQVSVGGDSRQREIRTISPDTNHPRWISYVSYSIRVPRTVHVTLNVGTADVVRVVNIVGNVIVKNVNGLVRLESVSGATTVDTINGNISADFPANPGANFDLVTVNGQVEVRVPQDANFQWVANTLRGEILTTLPVRGAFTGTVFRGNLNSPGGPTITTATLMGRAYLLRNGSRTSEATSVSLLRNLQGGVAAGKNASNREVPLRAPAAAETIQTPLVEGNLRFTTTLGNVFVGEIRGEAHINTGAGEVELNSVYGKCEVSSGGGPLKLGEIFGDLVARTSAGDVLIRAAREGGYVYTGGGIIRVVYTGGPLRLESNGGDILVRQASAPVSAETRSGDINITVDPRFKTQKVDAKTHGGNITLKISPGFGATVEANVTTSADNPNAITSDLPGLVIIREQVGKRMRIKATGKINGGGEKVTLSSEDGDIHIVTQTAPPITLMEPSGNQ
jgi:DUF4097 and DUF4098 domain-containing protein YvlB